MNPHEFVTNHLFPFTLDSSVRGSFFTSPLRNPGSQINLLRSRLDSTYIPSSIPELENWAIQQKRYCYFSHAIRFVWVTAFVPRHQDFTASDTFYFVFLNLQFFFTTASKNAIFERKRLRTMKEDCRKARNMLKKIFFIHTKNVFAIICRLYPYVELTL